jgi:hypothetical protein
MKRAAMIAMVGLLAASVQPARALADARSCKDAAESYSNAIDEIAYELKRYTSCLSSSDGRDDCSSEFRRLKFAQSDFETAVLRVSSECER